MTGRRQLVVALAVLLTVVLLLLSLVWRWNAAALVLTLDHRPLASGVGTYRLIRVRSASGHIFDAHVAVLAADAVRASLVEYPERETSRDGFAALLADGSTVAVNGGYFGINFEPVGALAVDGRQVSPRSDQPSLSGMVKIDRDGRLELAPGNADTSSAWHTVQAGPFLVDAGGQMGIHWRDERAAQRSVLAIAEDGQLVLCSTTEVTLYDLAHTLTVNPRAFGVERIAQAINLDGGPSAAAVFRTTEDSIVISPAGPIRNAIVFRARQAPSAVDRSSNEGC